MLLHAHQLARAQLYTLRGRHGQVAWRCAGRRRGAGRASTPCAACLDGRVGRVSVARVRRTVRVRAQSARSAATCDVRCARVRNRRPTMTTDRRRSTMTAHRPTDRRRRRPTTDRRRRCGCVRPHGSVRPVRTRRSTVRNAPVRHPVCSRHGPGCLGASTGGGPCVHRRGARPARRSALSSQLCRRFPAADVPAPTPESPRRHALHTGAITAHDRAHGTARHGPPGTGQHRRVAPSRPDAISASISSMLRGTVVRFSMPSSHTSTSSSSRTPPTPRYVASTASFR